MEAARPVCRHPAEELDGHGSGSIVISVGSQNGVWVKCTVAQVGPFLAERGAEQRQVVVLHEHGRPGRGDVDHRFGEARLTCAVGVPRVPPTRIEARLAGEVEEPMVEGPQRLVGMTS